MNLKLISGFSILVLLLSITAYAHNYAYAAPYLKNDIRSIMENYRIAIEKARADLRSAIEKANSDAKASIEKGIPTIQINVASKITIEKAWQDYKTALEKARSDAKLALYQIKLSIGSAKPHSSQH